MLSPSRSNLQYVYDMNEGVAKKRAVELLNTRKPQHPPDIYYIRRDAKKLEHFLDQDNMRDLQADVRPKNKLGYQMFKLHPEELEEMQAVQKRRRNFRNPSDPFFTKKTFEKQYSGVYNTGTHLDIIEPKDHR